MAKKTVVSLIIKDVVWQSHLNLDAWKVAFEEVHRVTFLTEVGQSL